VKFNRFVWELYKASKQGRAAVKRFLHPSSKLVDKELRDIEYTVDADGDVSVDVAKVLRNHASNNRLGNTARANQFFARMVQRGGFSFTTPHMGDDVELVFGEDDEDWYDFVAAVSLGLYMAHPEFFLPYNFRRKFDQLEEIHAEFGIPLPPVPRKADKRGRALYYAAINEAWQEFRALHRMSPAEMCAFLYDFAARSVTPWDVSDLPLPSKVWLVSGGRVGATDFDFVDGAVEETVSSWAGNPGVRRGDILLMYLVSPRCYIDSIWRSATDAIPLSQPRLDLPTGESGARHLSRT